MANYVIGDIHGCKDSLDQLLAHIDFGRNDQLWLVGDLVNRGPKSLAVLRWAMALGDRVEVVLGNHELYLLARAADAVPRKKHCTIDQVLNAPDASQVIDWLRHRPLFVHNEQFAMVHAGLHPSWTVPESKLLAAEVEIALQATTWQQAIKEMMGRPPRWSAALTGGDRWRAIVGYLTRVRTCLADGSMNSDFDGELADIPRDSVPWFEWPHANWQTHRVLFGHWAALGYHQAAFATCLDSGCVWKQRLSALRLEDGRFASIAACEI